MSKDQSPPAPVIDSKRGQYSDGHPLDEVQYLECKLILKPDRFTAAKVFLDYGKLVATTAKEFGVGFTNKGVVLKPAIREVVFLDTADFRLYNNAFILRRRIAYELGFPVGEPEIVLKFRHEDMQKAAALDVRPKFAGNYRIKFKAEALPLKDRVGGYRLLYSHNAQFPLSQAPEGDRELMGTLARVFPALEALKTSDTNRVELVNQTIVEEVLQDLGVLDFGKGITVDLQCQHLARARHSPPAVRRVRVPGQIQAPGRNPREGDKPLSAVLHRTAAVRSRLAVPRYDQDWARLSA